MKTLFKSTLFAAFLFAAAFTPKPAQAQTAGDVLVIQRSGTTSVTLPGLPSGASYSIIRSGTIALTSGTATVADVNVTAGSIITLTASGTTNAGNLGVGTIVSGTNFGISSTNASDARKVFWWFLKQ